MTEPVTFDELRRERGLSQEELAAITKLAIETIRNIETGKTKNPQPKAIKALALAMDLSTSAVWQSIRRTQSRLENDVSLDVQGVNNIDPTYNVDYRKCEDIFHTLASQNASCDVEIFSVLFVDTYRPKMIRAEKEKRLNAVNLCIKTVRVNLTDLLNATRDLFEAMHGSRCAACIQILETEEERSISSSSLKILLRDTRSSRDRPVGLKAIVGDNSLNYRMYVENEDCIVENDLDEKISRGEIKTSSKEAGKKYNALFMILIPAIGEEITRPLSTLCLDSVTNFRLDRMDVCVHFARELAWRMSAMLYRMSKLEREFVRLSDA